jgi:crossover junction endodeoxyribonuclease RuvC
MRILSIDPGYERLGVAILERKLKNKEILMFSECFKTPKELPFEERLVLIGERIEELIKHFSPEALCIENLFISNNQKTAMRVAEVRGAIIFICKKNGLSIKELTPLQIKLAVTGDGKSNKEQMIKMVNLLILGINKKAQDDEFDAIATGLAFFVYHR